MGDFDYETAFDRNIGWVTREELALLRGKRVLLVEKYEALSHLAHKNWERARSVFARIGGEGLRDALRPALIEGLAAGGVPYEQAAAMAARGRRTRAS